MNNIHNKLITRATIENVINKYMGDTPIYINNIKKFQKAFVHKSFCIVDSDNSDSDNFSVMHFDNRTFFNNERLEFLGDKVIDLITTEFLFDKYPTKDEGFLTKLKSRIVKKESLSYLGEKLGFKELLMISSHVERISGRNNPRFLEDIFESFMGILYKDQKSNLKICQKFLLGVYEEFIDLEKLINNNDNYKDSILRYFHSQGWGHPVYKTIYHVGNVYCREFTSILVISKELFTSEKSLRFVKRQEEIMKIVKRDSVEVLNQNGVDDKTPIENPYTTLESLLKDNILLGMGKSNTKKYSEQECSKDCLLNLNISVNY